MHGIWVLSQPLWYILFNGFTSREKIWCLWFSLSNRCFLKREKEQTAFLTAFESFKLLVVFGQRISLFIVSDKKKEFLI